MLGRSFIFSGDTAVAVVVVAAPGEVVVAEVAVVVVAIVDAVVAPPPAKLVLLPRRESILVQGNTTNEKGFVALLGPQGNFLVRYQDKGYFITTMRGRLVVPKMETHFFSIHRAGKYDAYILI